MKINIEDPYEGLDDEGEIERDEDFDAQLYQAAERVFGKPLIKGASAADAVSVGEPGDGADIDIDTLEPVGKGEVKSLETPAPLPDPFGVAFTGAELDALTNVDNEEAVKLAYAKAAPEKRALLSAERVKQNE